MAKITVKVPASTANLGPGFDVLGMALNLYNTVTLEECDQTGWFIDIKGEGENLIPRDSSNLIARTILYLLEKTDYQITGFKLSLDNKIPFQRGLGSSAGAIVGGLVAANALVGQPFSPDELLQMAVEIEGHPDNVAAALFGGVVIVAQNDNSLIYSRFVPQKGLKVTAVIPDFQLSTKRARSVLPEKVPLSDAVYNMGHLALLITALRDGDWELLGAALHDRLHQPYRCPLVPGLVDIMELAREAGAYGVFLSGAGPTVIAFTPPRSDIGGVLAGCFQSQGIKAQVLELEPSIEGASIVLEEH